MIKAISYWSMKDGLAGTHPIDDALRTAKATGFAGLELCIGPEGAFHTQMTQAQVEAIRKQVDASGVQVQTVAAGLSWGVNPTSDDPAVRQRSIELHAAALERAAWVGAKAMLMVPGVVKSPISPDIIRYDRAVERCREAVKRLLETADHEQIRMWCEANDYWPACLPKQPDRIRIGGAAFGEPEELELLDWEDWFVAFDKRNLKFVYDPTQGWFDLQSRNVRPD